MSEAAMLEDESLLETGSDVIEGSAEEIQYSEAELEAMEKGWSPEGVEGKRHLTAEEFLDRAPLYDKMHKLEKRLKEQEKKFDAMQQHEQMVRKRMHEDHLKELKTAKRAAMKDYDLEKAEELDEEIEKARQEYEESSSAPVVQSAEDIQSIISDWATKNTWYESDKVLRRFAEGEAQEFRMSNPNAALEDVLAHIAKSVKEEFPEKFQNMNRNKPASVEGSVSGARRTPAAPKQKTVKDLPEEAISVMRTLVRAGAFKSEQDYVNDYFNQK